MARPVEIATYVLASAIALGGGYIGAEMLLGGDAPQAQPAPQQATPVTAERTTGSPPEKKEAVAPVLGAEARDSRYGFSFRYPEGWQLKSSPHPKVVVAVTRSDGAACLVSVEPIDVPMDENGKPQRLDRMLHLLKPAYITHNVTGANVRLMDFQPSTMGDQEARRFAMDATAPAPVGKVKIVGRTTIRDYGVIVVLCLAQERLASTSDIRAAFDMVQSTFRFD